MKETKENAIITTDVVESNDVIEEKSKTTFWTKCKEFGDSHPKLKKAVKIVGLTLIGGAVGLGAGYVKGAQDAFDYSVTSDDDIIGCDEGITDDSTDSNES